MLNTAPYCKAMEINQRQNEENKIGPKMQPLRFSTMNRYSEEEEEEEEVLTAR